MINFFYYYKCNWIIIFFRNILVVVNIKKNNFYIYISKSFIYSLLEAILIEQIIKKKKIKKDKIYIMINNNI